MNKELYVSSTPHETKVAIVEDDALAEIYYERENEYTLAGSIYKGRVTRVLPGMQSAFVDIGLERDAFLYVSDFLETEDEEGEIESIPVGGNGGGQQPGRQERRPQQPQQVAPEPDEQDAEIADAVRSQFQPAPSGDGQGEPEGEENGARRWRGRSRRRRGRGGFPESKFAHPQGQPPAEADSDEETAAPAPPEREVSAQPEPPAVQSYEPIVLPGESISKYQRRDENAPQAEQPAVESAPPREPRRERGERDGGKRGFFDRFRRNKDRDREPREPEAYVPPEQGRILLPGESISKYRNVAEAPITHAPGDEHDQPLAGITEQVALVPHPEVSTAPEHEAPERTYGAEMDHGLPPATAHDHHPSFEQSFQNISASSAAEAEEVVEDHIPTSAPDIRTEVADARGPAPEEDEIVAPVAAIPGHEVDGPEAETAPDTTVTEQQLPPAAEPVPHHFAPGKGPVEEEVIEEEEAELPPPSVLSEDGEFEELEEEEKFHPGTELADVLEMARDAAADAAAAAAAAAEDEDEEDEDEEEFEEEEGELAESDVLSSAEEVEGEEELDEGRAEVRGAPGTAGMQRPADRKFDPRRLQRGRRGGRRIRGGPGRGRSVQRQTIAINELLKEGQEILIQIAKEPIGKKGARITSHIALPGRFLVYMPTVTHVGVSRKISSEEERQRLKRIVVSERENGIGGFIVRTAADGVDEDELRADIRFLKGMWSEIKQRADSGKAPALIYHDLNLVERLLRDQLNDNFTQIWVDTESEYERVLRFVSRFQPALVRRVKLYTRETPLFEQFKIQEEINKALKSKVWLKSGGYIVINQTEALVAVDVNTGKYVGKTGRLEDTIVKTNVDAIKEIVRQIRLRDLGGIIVIDFIDMDERKNRQKVMQALEEALRSDRAPSKVLQFNDFGLVAITRKRVKHSLERTLGTQCDNCEGTGLVKSVTTVINELWIELRKMHRHLDGRDVTLRVHPEVAKALKANGAKWLSEMEELTGKPIIVQGDPLVHQEQFDIN